MTWSCGDRLFSVDPMRPWKGGWSRLRVAVANAPTAGGQHSLTYLPCCSHRSWWADCAPGPWWIRPPVAFVCVCGRFSTRSHRSSLCVSVGRLRCVCVCVCASSNRNIGCCSQCLGTIIPLLRQKGYEQGASLSLSVLSLTVLLLLLLCLACWFLACYTALGWFPGCLS